MSILPLPFPLIFRSLFLFNMRLKHTILLSALLLPGVARADASWPAFRGPTMQGIASEKGLPDVIDEKGAVWKTAIHGKAWSSPVVADGNVWLSTATPDGKELSVVRVDAKSGKITLDKVLFHVANPQFCIDFNSYASPTPILEGDRVYITFGSPGTACLDAKTGEKIWERTDLECNHFRGSGSSPTLYQDRLIMNFDGSDFQYIVALDKKTGKTLWKTDRTTNFRDIDPKTNKPKADGDYRKSFSTPRIATFNGRTEIVSVGSKCAFGYDPATGKELWKLEFFSLGNTASHTVGVTPVIGPDYIYICTGNGKEELLAVKPGGSGTLGPDAVAWKLTQKNIPKRSSPLLVDGLLYMMDDGAIASCVDAKTGEVLWKERMNGKGCSASPICADGKIYFFTEGGVVTTIAQGREFKKIGEGQFNDESKQIIMATPAVADAAFYVRTRTQLWKVGKK